MVRAVSFFRDLPPQTRLAFAAEMALNGRQLRTARVATAEARRLGANRHEILALIEAGLVEKNLIHTAGGDRDSMGFLQQRPSQGWGPFISGARGIRVDTRDFIKRAMALRGRGLSSGQIAAEVQRPAAQYRGRYAERRGDAGRVLRSLGGGGAVVAGGGGGGGRGAGAGIPSLESELGALVGPDLSSLLPQRTPPPSTAPPEPAFSARARLPMPGGAQLVPAASGAPAPKVNVLSLLQRAAVGGGGVAGLTALTGPQGGGGGGGAAAGGGGGGGGGRLGKVTIAPTANREGAPLHNDVIRFVRGVAGALREPLTIGTGTNHSRLTINGTESDHWRGEGADVPLAGGELVRAGRAALIRAGMDPKKAKRINGGGFNVGGWQIIFNTNAPGWGDHTDHLHVGRRRG